MKGNVVIFPFKDILIFSLQKYLQRKKFSASSHSIEPHASAASSLVQVSLKLAEQFLKNTVFCLGKSQFIQHQHESCFFLSPHFSQFPFDRFSARLSLSTGWGDDKSTWDPQSLITQISSYDLGNQINFLQISKDALEKRKAKET